MTADRLLLWRHGRTASNAGGRFQGQLDVPLDDVGRVQVKEAAEALAREIGGRPCRLVVSDLSRARDTGQTLAEVLGLSLILDSRLREIHAGAWEGLLRSEARERDPALFARWLAGDDVPVGGGERRGEAGARAAAAIRELADGQDDGLLVVAGHGAALRGAILSLTGIVPWTPHVLGGLRNAHWADLVRRNSEWVLEGYNLGPPPGSTGAEG